MGLYSIPPIFAGKFESEPVGLRGDGWESSMYDSGGFGIGSGAGGSDAGGYADF